MAGVGFKPSAKRTRESEEVEVNLLPMMNIVCSLIALLMGVAQMADITMLEYLPPAEAAEADNSGAPPAEKPRWNNDATIDVLVNVAATGFQVSLFGKNEPGPYFFEIPRIPGGDYDFKTLNQRLAEAKQREVGDPIGIDSTMNDLSGKMDVYAVYRYKDGREVSITALDKTDFQTVIHTMDACHEYTSASGEKKELFPVAMLKQFQ